MLLWQRSKLNVKFLVNFDGLPLASLSIWLFGWLLVSWLVSILFMDTMLSNNAKLTQHVSPNVPDSEVNVWLLRSADVAEPLANCCAVDSFGS